MCDHPAEFSAKVARIIDLGVEGNGSSPTAEDLPDVPEATVGSWWITEVAIDECDLETYRCLARHAAEFRENIWTRPRQLKRAKYVLEMVEAEMKIFRLRRCLDRMDRELDPVGAHNMEELRSRSDEGADVGSNAEQERI